MNELIVRVADKDLIVIDSRILDWIPSEVHLCRKRALNTTDEKEERQKAETHTAENVLNVSLTRDGARTRWTGIRLPCFTSIKNPNNIEILKKPR